VIDGSERVDDVQHEYWDPILDRLEERGELPPDLVRTEVVEWLTFIHVGLCARASASAATATTSAGSSPATWPPPSWPQG